MFKIYNYKNHSLRILEPIDDIASINVDVICGDEVITIFKNNGEVMRFDSSEPVTGTTLDGSYSITDKETLHKWINYPNTIKDNISYNRLKEFGEKT